MRAHSFSKESLSASAAKVHPPVRIATRRRCAAFSLVEVALALGLFAFALVALLGLLPVAFQACRDSLDISTAAQVADAVAARLQANFSSLEQGDFVEFDDRGDEATSSAAAVYRAKLLSRDSLSDSLDRVEVVVSRSNTSAQGRHFCYLIFNNR